MGPGPGADLDEFRETDQALQEGFPDGVLDAAGVNASHLFIHSKHIGEELLQDPVALGHSGSALMAPVTDAVVTPRRPEMSMLRATLFLRSK
jgi:hypothetical protein